MPKKRVDLLTASVETKMEISGQVRVGSGMATMASTCLTRKVLASDRFCFRKSVPMFALVARREIGCLCAVVLHCMLFTHQPRVLTSAR